MFPEVMGVSFAVEAYKIYTEETTSHSKIIEMM